MNVILSEPLQTAIYDQLVADSALNTLIGNDIFDALPSGSLPDLYLLIGEEQVFDASDVTVSANIHTFELTAVTSRPGFAPVKEVAAAAVEALSGEPPSLSRGRIAGLEFAKSETHRDDTAGKRLIRMRFRAFVEDI